MAKNFALRIWRIAYAWTCNVCMTVNERGNVCSHCGAEKPGSGGGGSAGGHGH